MAPQDYYSRFNAIRDLPTVVVAYNDGQPVGAAAVLNNLMILLWK